MKWIFSVLFVASLVLTNAQDKEDEAYTLVIQGRSDKVVDEMTFCDQELKVRVRDLIMDHYRFLNDEEDARNADVAQLRVAFADNIELRDAKIDLRKAEQELKVRDHHFSFISALKMYITEEQIDQVKDGLTYYVCPNTYKAFQDMIPDLKPEEKDQMLIWLTEAREHAIDGGSSKDKHAWFGKYKGRINNYLSERGYDLKKLSEDWHVRMRAKGIDL